MCDDVQYRSKATLFLQHGDIQNPVGRSKMWRSLLGLALVSAAVVYPGCATENEHAKRGLTKEGRDRLNHRIIQNLVERILELDQEYAPFNLIAVESNEFGFNLEVGNGRTVKLGGTVDRMDEKIEITRTIDYKTGKSDIQKILLL